MSILLAKCGACGNEVSVKATACPKCGQPNHQAAAPVQIQLPLKGFQVGPAGITGIVVVALLGLGLISNLTTKHSEYDGPRAPSSYDPGPQADERGYEPRQAQAEQRGYDRRPTQAYQREPSRQHESGGLESKFGPKPDQSQASQQVSEYLRQQSPDPMRITSCMKVKSDERAGWIVGCAFQGRGPDGANTKYANWFVIQNGRVVKDLPKNAYSID